MTLLTMASDFCSSVFFLRSLRQRSTSKIRMTRAAMPPMMPPTSAPTEGFLPALDVDEADGEAADAVALTFEHEI